MKYLTTTFAIACMAFGFASIVATPAQANEAWKCSHNGGQWNIRSNGEGVCDEPSRVYGEINNIDSLEQVAIEDDDQYECDTLKQDQKGVKLCVVTDENGTERVAGIEVPDGVEFAGRPDKYDWSEACAKGQCTPSGYKTGDAEGEQVAWDTWGNQGEECWETVTKNGPETKCVPSGWGGSPKSEEAEGEQFAGGKRDYLEWCGQSPDKCPESGGKHEDFEPVKTASGTFYPLPMIDVASMDKLLAPGGTSVASFDKILAPGGTAVESDYQFADREDGSGGDFGDSGGGDFGEGDRAAASTAAE